MKKEGLTLLTVLVLCLAPACLQGCGGRAHEGGDGNAPVIRSRFGPPEPGVHALTDIASLPVMRFGSVAKQVSSHDKTGGNDDGFSGGTQLYVDENGEYVVFDDYGPGCIYRVWFTALLAWMGQLRIYVDDMDAPVVDTPFVCFFLSTVDPFLYPLTNAFHETSGGYATYIPICYEKRAKITLSVPPEFYGITYRRYDIDQTVTSFSGAEDYRALFEQWTHTGEDPKPSADLRRETGTLTIEKQRSGRLISETGRGAIWNLFVEVEPFEQDVLSSLWILARWDGHPENDVEAPLNEFFGSFYANRSPKALLLGKKDRRFFCMLPMPYWRSAELALENRGEKEVQVSFDVDVLEEPYPLDAGYFTTRYRREEPTTAGRDYLFAEIQGSGHYIGVSYTMTGAITGTYMEGDERFHVDGSLSPALYGTGTEDYFNGGWYFEVTGPFANPLHGSPYRLKRVGNQSRTGCYRMHVGDLVPFFQEAHLGIEHDATNGDTEDAHSSVAYFYRRPEPGSILSDELDLGDAGSRTAHQYESPDAEDTGEVVSYFEGDDDRVLVPDRGHRMRTQSEFLLDIDPRNRGVLLRRRFDQFQGRQRAVVYVDDVHAGVWYDVFENPVLRWAESDFPLPASLTKGKARIRVRVENKGQVPWSEFAYTAFSYVSPSGK